MANWTREEENIFEETMFEEEEDMVSMIPEDTWHRIAQNLPGKTAQEVASHYEDVCAIEVDLIDPGWRDEGAMYKGGPWTGIEHRNFLRGMDKYGKGDWRSISEEFVISRTHTQVASHAQKYFLRLQKRARRRGKKRSRIHPGDP